MSIPKVTNLRSPRSGEPVANQYEINDGGVYIFQSYDTLIAKYHNMHYTISRNYDYSRTTSKYFHQWIQDNGMNSEEYTILKKWLKTAKFSETLSIGEFLTVRYVEDLN